MGTKNIFLEGTNIIIPVFMFQCGHIVPPPSNTYTHTHQEKTHFIPLTYYNIVENKLFT